MEVSKMQREIKFRGKRVDNGEWVYGGLWISKVNDYYIITADYLKTKERIGLMSIGTLEDETHMHWVKRDTVGQFTGLLDKNGKQIYEGDIVNWGIDGREKPTRIAQVMFKPDIIFNSNVGIFNYGDFAYQDTYNHLTVIGNIHDNPELFEVSNA